MRYGCPLAAITDDAHHWMTLYGHYKNGFLLTGGGIGDQPARYVRAMTLIETELAKADHEQKETAERERRAREYA